MVRVSQIYVGADREQNWNALLGMITLFRRIAREMGQALGYGYPEELDQRVMTYLELVRSLDGSSTCTP